MMRMQSLAGGEPLCVHTPQFFPWWLRREKKHGASRARVLGITRRRAQLVSRAARVLVLVQC